MGQLLKCAVLPSASTPPPFAGRYSLPKDCYREPCGQSSARWQIIEKIPYQDFGYPADGLRVELRRESRLEPHQSARVKILGLTRGPVLEASILDISGSGMRILSKLPIPCGALIEIEANQTVSRGTVCRCNEQGLSYEVGIQVSESAPAPLVL
jgi:hypothetical protein